MPSVAVDTGLLVAVMARDDKHFEAAIAFFKSNTSSLVTTAAVLTEAAYLLSYSDSAAVDMLKWASSSIEVDGETGADLPRIIAIMEKYADLPADFTDASLVALCERRGIDSIVTLDSDFDVYQMVSGTMLRNVFRNRAGV
jgi:uncharacterized protein